MNDQAAEIVRLRGLLGEANKTIHNQERQIDTFGKVLSAAHEVVKLAVWSRAGYSLSRKPIEDLWAALEGIQNNSPNKTPGET
jgi:hypothetical protein